MSPGVVRTAETPRRAIRVDIQGLRALAVLLVILNHVFGWPGGGFVGVDVFFVISGFIITSTLLREWDRDGTISFAGFYIRRIKRILPAAVLVLIATFVAAAVLLPLERARSVAVDSIWVLFFGANFRMQAEGVDYFQQSLPASPLQHYWSLSIEEQFYFIWPWLMLGVLYIATKYIRGRGAAKLILLGVIGLGVLASLAWGLVETSEAPTAAYFSSLARFWELGVGALAAIALPLLLRQRIAPSIGAVISYIGVAGIIASVFVINEGTAFPGTAALLPVAGALLVMIGGYGGDAHYSHLMMPLTNRAARYVGDISYSLYLWHWPIAVLMLAILPRGGRYFAAVLLLTFILSALSYRFVEDPIRRSSWPARSTPAADGRTRSRLIPIIGFASALVLAVGGVGTLGYRSAGADTSTTLSAFDQYAAANEEQAAIAAAAAPCRGAGYFLPANDGCDVSAIPLTPSVDAMQTDYGDFGSLTGQDCSRNEGGSPIVCHFGSSAADATTVALIGDSHIEMYLPAMVVLAEQQNWAVTTYIDGAQRISSELLIETPLVAG